MPSVTDVINTSNLAKLYRTTTSDIEKKLTTMGFKPVRTVIQQSGRRFMVWDRKQVVDALDAYKQERLDMLRAREAQKEELALKAMSIPRTGYRSPDIIPPSDFAGLEEIVKMPVSQVEALAKEMKELRERLAALENGIKQP